MKKFLLRQGLTIFTFLFIFYCRVNGTTYPINVTFSGSQEVPSNNSTATGTFIGTYNDATDSLIYTVTFSGLSSNSSAAHFHASPPGISGPILINITGVPFPLGVTSGTFKDTIVLTATQEDSLKKGLLYFNIHTTNFQGGEIRAQIFLQDATFVIPDIICPRDTTVSATAGTCAASVAFGADTNTAVPTATLFYRVGNTLITSPNSFSVGTTTVTAIALNGAGFDTCSFKVVVRDTTPPVITCPADTTRPNDPGKCGAIVNFRPATATDLCSKTVTITYSQNPGTFFPVGTTTVTATATDSSGNKASCSFHVTVNDVEPPVIHDLTLDPRIIWAPNHKMKNVSVDYTTTDNCPGPITCQLTVTSDEPVNGTGDGNSSPDWVLVNDHLVKVRAERSGTGDGRVYSIIVACTDAHGNTGKDTATVLVPHNRGLLVRGIPPGWTNGHGNPHGTNTAVIMDEESPERTTLVSVYPNPSVGYFNIEIETGNFKDKISVRIFDVSGRVLEVKNELSGNQTIRMGDNLKAGFYIAEIRQGNQTKQVKLVKQ